MATSLPSLYTAVLLITSTKAFCDNVYTVGDDEFCTISMSSFEEECITLDSNYSIAATNGLAIDPLTETIYIVASIGAKNGMRTLFTFDEATEELTAITATETTHKLASIAFLCDAQLFGVTGSQNDHDLFRVDISDGSLTLAFALDESILGTAIAYDPFTDYLYRVAGTTQLYIEQIDYETGNITADYYIDSDVIAFVRAIGYYKDDYLFLIDDEERLFELDVRSGDLTLLHTLSSTRKHKGIICTDYHLFCTAATTTTATTEEAKTVTTSTTTVIETTEDVNDNVGERLASGIMFLMAIHLMLMVFE